MQQTFPLSVLEASAPGELDFGLAVSGTVGKSIAVVPSHPVRVVGYWSRVWQWGAVGGHVE